MNKTYAYLDYSTSAASYKHLYLELQGQLMLIAKEMIHMMNRRSGLCNFMRHMQLTVHAYDPS